MGYALERTSHKMWWWVRSGPRLRYAGLAAVAGSGMGTSVAFDPVLHLDR